MTPEQEAAFLSARAKCGRDALTQFKKSESITDLAALIEKFRSLPLLLDQTLLDGCIDALQTARGSLRTGAEPFPATIWTHGAEHTHGGRPFLGSLRDFAERILPARAREIAPKRSGWVLEPTTNPAGRRTNDETHAVHALFLDCDGAGEWDLLLEWFWRLNFCHIAYQSGGWAPDKPKWRIVLPLDVPHSTTTEHGRDAWRAIYWSARVCFGALARLSSTGFDASTDTPCCPWFLTEKRAAEDPERIVRWRPGHSLDLMALALALPEIPTEEHAHDERGPVQTVALSPQRTEEIIDALAGATAHVPAGRRDIYLAVPAVLLNRGAHPDDVLAIMEEVSLRYPRHHADKHADNIHCARTTIDKWLTEGSGARITQIGTLQALAPEVAAALDEVFPDPLHTALMETFEEQPRVHAPQRQNTDAPAPPRTLSPPRKKRRKLSKIGKALVAASRRLLADKKHPDRQVQGYLLDRLTRGESLATDEVQLSRADDLVEKVMQAAGYHLHDETPWQSVLDEAGPTLLAMNHLSSEQLAAARIAFEKGQIARKRAKYKRAVKKENERETLARAARKCVL